MKNLEAFLAPLHERRAKYVERPELVDDILAEGNKAAKAEASRTMQDVREAMHM